MANLNGHEGQYPLEEDADARANLLIAAAGRDGGAVVDQRLHQLERANAELRQVNVELKQDNVEVKQRLDQVLALLSGMQLQPTQPPNQGGGANPAGALPVTAPKAQANYLPNLQRINQLTPNNHSAQILTPVATFTAQINYPPPGPNVGGPSTFHMVGTPSPYHYSTHVRMPTATLNAQDNHSSIWYNGEGDCNDEKVRLHDKEDCPDD